MIAVYHNEMRIFRAILKQEELSCATIIVARVADDFRDGAFAVVEIA